MKMQTMKKTMSLIIATLMLALATPFAMMTVAADEATPTKIEIVNVSAFGNHLKADGSGTSSLKFYASYPAAFAFDGDITSDAQILNNDDIGHLQYEMCYFDENGAMQNGTNASGKSYYLMFIIELSGDAKIDTLSLWTPWLAASSDQNFMANNGYDIYYSADGEKYTAVEDATFSNVYTNKDTNGLYKAGTYNGKNGHVHEIDMKDVTAEFVAIAVSELVYNWDEAILSEVVLMGNAIVDDNNDDNNQDNQNNGSQSSQNKTEDTKASTDTKADTSAATETVAAEEKGCGGVIGGASIALVSAFAAGVALKSKKKENN